MCVCVCVCVVCAMYVHVYVLFASVCTCICTSGMFVCLPLKACTRERSEVACHSLLPACMCAGVHPMSQQPLQPQRVSLSRRPIKATEPFGSAAVGGNNGKPSSLWSQGSPLPVTTPTGGKKGSSVDRRGSPVSSMLHSPKGLSLLELMNYHCPI